MSKSEVVLNLWYVMDEGTAAIYRLFGRAYALEGTDEEKLQTLRRLAKTYYLVAYQFSVPERFAVVQPDGRERTGVAFWYEQEGYAFELFKEVINEIEKELPEQVSFVFGEPNVTKLKLPQDPLFLLTSLIEDEFGNITPKAKPAY